MNYNSITHDLCICCLFKRVFQMVLAHNWTIGHLEDYEDIVGYLQPWVELPLLISQLANTYLILICFYFKRVFQ